MTVEIPYAYVLAAVGIGGCVVVGALAGLIVTAVRGER